MKKLHEVYKNAKTSKIIREIVDDIQFQYMNLPKGKFHPPRQKLEEHIGAVFTQHMGDEIKRLAHKYWVENRFND